MRPRLPEDRRDTRGIAIWTALVVSLDLEERYVWVRVVHGGPGWHLTRGPCPPDAGTGYIHAATVSAERACRMVGPLGAVVSWAEILALSAQLDEALAVADKAA